MVVWFRWFSFANGWFLVWTTCDFSGVAGFFFGVFVNQSNLEPQGQPFISMDVWWFPTMFDIKIWFIIQIETIIYKWLALGFQESINIIFWKLPSNTPLFRQFQFSHELGDTMENTVEISPNLLEIYFAPSILLLEPLNSHFLMDVRWNTYFSLVMIWNIETFILILECLGYHVLLAP